MSLLAYSNNKQPKEQKVYGVPSAFSIFKKILKIVLTFLGRHGILYFVAGQESSEDKKTSLRGVAQLG